MVCFCRRNTDTDSQLPYLPYNSLFAEENPDRRRRAATAATAAIGWLAKVGAFVRVARGGGGGEGSGSTMSSLLPDEEDAEADQAHLYLNVYDLTPINKYLYWLGLGVFHSGIEGIAAEFSLKLLALCHSFGSVLQFVRLFFFFFVNGMLLFVVWIEKKIVCLD